MPTSLGRMTLALSKWCVNMAFSVLTKSGKILPLPPVFENDSDQLKVPDEELWMEYLAINSSASPGPALRRLGRTSNGSAVKAGDLEQQVRGFLQLLLHGDISDLSTAMIGGMPWDMVFAKRKCEARETTANLEKVRLYFETNAGVQATLGLIVNTLSRRIESARDSSESRAHERLAHLTSSMAPRTTSRRFG